MYLDHLLLLQILIVHRNPRLPPCAPFALTGWGKLEDPHMYNAGSSNRPGLYRNHPRKQLLCERKMPISLYSRPGDVPALRDLRAGMDWVLHQAGDDLEEESPEAQLEFGDGQI